MTLKRASTIRNIDSVLTGSTVLCPTCNRTLRITENSRVPGQRWADLRDEDREEGYTGYIGPHGTQQHPFEWNRCTYGHGYRGFALPSGSLVRLVARVEGIIRVDMSIERLMYVGLTRGQADQALRVLDARVQREELKNEPSVLIDFALRLVRPEPV